MKSSRLDYLKRKQHGRTIGSTFKEVLEKSGLQLIQYIDLFEADVVLDNLKSASAGLPTEDEMLDEDAISSLDSQLVYTVYREIQNDSVGYIFPDGYHYSGLFLVHSKPALSMLLNIAKADANNTCFLLDHSFKYFFRVNYYDSDHIDYPNKYDIQRIFLRGN